MKASAMDYKGISTLFHQHNQMFRTKDVDMWLDIEKEIRDKEGFFLGRDRQRWFDELETTYQQLCTSMQPRE